MSQCRSCQADVFWITLQSGAKIPCDPEVLTAWIVEGKAPDVGKAGERVSLVTDEGQVFHGWRGSNLTPGSREVTGRVSHFSSCPQADQWRKKR